MKNIIWKFATTVVILGMVIVSYRVYVGHNIFTGENTIRESVQPAKEMVQAVEKETIKEKSSPFWNGEFGQLLTTRNWERTTPGILVDRVFGPGWANWIIWPLTLLLGWILVKSVVRLWQNKPSKSDGSTGDIIAAVVAITIIWGVIQIVGYFTDPPERKAPTKQVTVDFRQGKIGSVKNVNLLSNQTIRVLMEPVRQGSRYENCFSWLVLGSGEMETASKGLGVVIIRFDEKTRRELADSILTVQISKGIVPMGSPGSECSAKKIN